ncbi:hypothetical protein E4U17_003760 [Claviceps sp. LM77 group G4]|nr:hypothetical protein E4U17_003760 [Claviceps sp. LM77 group G4]KAG6074746.1 hypothetical protein E4U16_003792 [Claviceps sp. LM84 group G4]
MERKRKIPPRAAARQEQAAKKRISLTRRASSTPTVVELPPRDPTPRSPSPPTPPPTLPTTIEVGKPLPTIEEAQAADLSSKEYQSLTESGVLAESIVRSRNQWINQGLFEKFWAKPHKRKGVLQEDSNNPPKDSMMKVGTVTITIEPHIVEATMFAVKTSKLLPHQRKRFEPNPLQQSSGDAQQTESSNPAASTQAPPQRQVETVSKDGQPPPGPSSSTPRQTSSTLVRPVLQYGPHNGSMPPQKRPAEVDATSAAGARTDTTALPAPLPANTVLSVSASKPGMLANTAPTRSTDASPVTPQLPVSTVPAATTLSAPVTTTVRVPTSSTAPVNPVAASHADATIKTQYFAPAPLAQQRQAQQPVAGLNQKRLPQSPSTVSHSAVPPATASAVAQPQTATIQVAIPAPKSHATHAPSPRQAPAPNQSAPPAAGKPVTTTGTPAPSAVIPPKPAATDPVIALLAQRASKDAELRDLMKRVAVGEAKSGELAQFQKIIDQLNVEYRQKGGQQGPSADRLLVDGRTVKYFAEEVRTILDIVLTSNPNQKSAELRPPPRSDALVVLLVKTALEDQRTKDMIRRIADGKPGFTDATDLKQILDRLHRDAKIVPKTSQPGPSSLRAATTSGPSNASSQLKASAPKPTPQSNPQALRSKGPPPVSRPDISAVVFDFGSGDRYLFPRFSVLEFLPTKSGQEVVASFLIVRRGSTSEYGGDPDLDYYQPITIRLRTNSGRHLENLTRVVAPQDEVRRYMDDVMDNMTRAEYVLLAMRLPRGDVDSEHGVSIDESKESSPTPNSEPDTDPNSTLKPGVLWTTNRNTDSNNKAANPPPSVKLRDPEQDAQSKYERLIRSVAEKETIGA